MIIRPAPYLPFLDPRQARPPGLWALPEADWIEIDAAYAEQMAYRDRLIREKGADVAVSTPDGDAAVRELSRVLVQHLLTCRGADFRETPNGVRRPDGVEVETPTEASDAASWIATLGRFVQEDFCLLRQGDGETEHRLVAANLCFPSHWRLSDKIGRRLLAIHDPVPDYADSLAARVERVHAALHVERPLQRLNYALHDTAELHLPAGREAAATANAAFCLRVERQTLRRLPETRAIVFGIKSYVTPIADLDRHARDALVTWINALTPEQLAYKGGARNMERAVAALRASPRREV